VVLEYGINDLEAHVDAPLRRSFERLIRKLLQYPNRPAVAVLSTYKRTSESPPLGPPWGGSVGGGERRGKSWEGEVGLHLFGCGKVVGSARPPRSMLKIVQDGALHLALHPAPNPAPHPVPHPVPCPRHTPAGPPFDLQTHCACT
jgi:hypothetical protein